MPINWLELLCCPRNGGALACGHVVRSRAMALDFLKGSLLLGPFNRLIVAMRWCVARSHYILVRGVRLELETK